MFIRKAGAVLFVMLMVPAVVHAGSVKRPVVKAPAAKTVVAKVPAAQTVTPQAAPSAVRDAAPAPAATAVENPAAVPAPEAVVVAQGGEGGTAATPAGDGLVTGGVLAKPAESGDAGEDEEIVKISDPLEPWNRAMFTFNDKLYFWVLKPAAQGYSAVAPQPVRVAMRNLFSNAAAPVRFVNALLQLKFRVAGTELSRFTLNTTFGVAGLFDVAEDQFNLSSQSEDLGQTLGNYGVGFGPYIVWPVFGPSSLRDSIGLAGDSFLSPLNYIDPVSAMFGVRTYETVNKTSLVIGEYEDMKEATVEPYVSVRDAFAQRRAYLIKE